jgi:Flp pilus assembly pilin Flp
MRTLWNAMADVVGRVATSGEREGGQTLAEYSLILTFLAISVIVALAAFGAVTTGMFWDPINRVFTDVLSLF